MKKFLVKSIRTLIIIVAFHAIALIFFANGKIDNFYLRFTSPKQTSLIIGNSRSAQGILPQVLDTTLNGNVSMYNYSFTINRSPFGPYYQKAIQKKLKQEEDGTFIVAVDPWSLSLSDGENENIKSFKEQYTIPYIIENPNKQFNLNYLFNNYYSAWGDMIIANTLRTEQTVLHDNGWLEVNIHYTGKNYIKRIKEKSKIYKGYAQRYSISNTRLSYLASIVEELSNYGNVFLVRLPVHSIIYAIEQDYTPQLDSKIDSISSDLSVPYFVFPPNDSLYEFTDGNHLYKESGKLVTHMLADSINSHLK